MRFDNEECGERSNMVLQTEYLCLPQIHALKYRISFDITVFGGGGLWKVIRFRWAVLVAHLVKNQLAMQETQVQSLGGEASLEKEMATHSSILAWKIPWTEETGGLQSMGSQRVRRD